MHINETFIIIVHQIRHFVFNFRSGRGHCGRDRMDSQLPMKSVSTTTDVVSSNPVQGEVYNIM